MIGSLRGVILERSARSPTAGEVLVEVGGVGYRLSVTSRTLESLGLAGSPAFFHVHTLVREGSGGQGGAIVLYGFATREELSCFEALLSARGVGPGVALALLSVHSPAVLQRAVLTGDADTLALVPGIGKKTAARLLVELKARFEAMSDVVDVEAVASGNGGPAPAGELRAALSSLGYGPEEIRHALSAVGQDGTLEDRLRQALRELAAAS